MTVQPHKPVWTEIALKFVIKFNAVAMPSVDLITVIMHAATVWMDTVEIHWLHVNDPSVQQTMIAHSIWLVWTNAVKIHAIVHRVLNVALIIILPHVNAYQDMLAMLTQDVLWLKFNIHHNVRLMLIVHRNWLASIMFVRIHALKRDHAELMPFARLLIHYH